MTKDQFNFLEDIACGRFWWWSIRILLEMVTINIVLCCKLPKYCSDRFSESIINTLSLMKLYKICSEKNNFNRECPKSAKKLTENGSQFQSASRVHVTWCYRIYSITIGFSDLENVGVDTKFVFLSWPKTEIGAIQFSEHIDCGRFWRWSIWISLEMVHYKSSFMF